MAIPKRQFIDGRYGQMHLRIAGPETPTRPALVCLHMFPQSGRNFEKLVAAASEHRIVVAPDFPGYGESDPPPSPITASDYAASAWDVVDSLALTDGFGQVDLFGIHAGAKLAVEVAYQRPDEVNKILLSSAAVLYPDELERLRKVFTPIPLDEDGTRFKVLWDMLTKNRGPEMTYEMMATSLAEILRGGEGYEWGHHAVFDYNHRFPDVLRSLHHPIALLNPKDDLYEMTPRTLSYIQNGELFDRPEWGHGFLEVYAADVARTVDDFLS